MRRHEFDNHEAWHNRGYLPHYEAGDKLQMITYRLGDSLPGSVGGSPAKVEDLQESDLDRRKRIESLLDNGYGSCVLKNPRIAQMVIENWQFFDGKRYDLIAYVVMPNHVHLLIRTYVGWSLSDVLHSWKSYTSHEMKKILQEEECKGNSGKSSTSMPLAYAGEPPTLPGWQEEYWDRLG